MPCNYALQLTREATAHSIKKFVPKDNTLHLADIELLLAGAEGEFVEGRFAAWLNS
jgi:hypothetical protein